MRILQISKKLLKRSKHYPQCSTVPAPAINFQLRPYKNQCLNKTINLPCIVLAEIFSKFFKIFIVLIYFLQILFSNCHFCFQKIYPANLCNYSIKLLKISKTFTQNFPKLSKSFSNTFVCFAQIVKNVSQLFENLHFKMFKNRQLFENNLSNLES